MTTRAPFLCPACAFEQDDGTTECVRCGVVFTKLRERLEDRTDRSIEVHAEYRPDSDARAWRLLGIGAVAAIVVHLVGFPRLVLSPLVTLLHELGHAVAAWMLGCPAVPAFDFAHGGGVTYHQAFQRPLAALIGLGWLGLAWIFRRNLRALAVIGVIGLLWVSVITTEWHREVVIAAMGHGGELILAGALLWMALSGRGWRMPEIERPLGAFAGWFVLIETSRFAWQLVSDEAFVATYREGKGGAMLHDLEVIALDVQIWTAIPVEIGQVAALLLGATLLTPLCVAALFAFRERTEGWTRSLLALER